MLMGIKVSMSLVLAERGRGANRKPERLFGKGLSEWPGRRRRQLLANIYAAFVQAMLSCVGGQAIAIGTS